MRRSRHSSPRRSPMSARACIERWPSFGRCAVTSPRPPQHEQRPSVRQTEPHAERARADAAAPAEDAVEQLYPSFIAALRQARPRPAIEWDERPDWLVEERGRAFEHSATSLRPRRRSRPADEGTQRPAERPSIRVLLADGSPLRSSGRLLSLDEAPEIEVVGEVATGGQVLEWAHSLHLDVVVLDASVPGFAADTVVAHLQRELPAIAVVVVENVDTGKVITTFCANKRDGVPPTVTSYSSARGSDLLCDAVIAAHHAVVGGSVSDKRVRRIGRQA